MTSSGSQQYFYNSNPQSIDVKVVLLGDQGVGKTSIVNRFMLNKFYESPSPTIGACFCHRSIVISGTKVCFRVWDTAGQERYRSLTPMYYRGADAAILVYAVDSAASFETVKFWVEELRSHAPSTIQLALVGNKCDVPEEERVISSETGEAFAKEINAFFVETSAKAEIRINDLFQSLGGRIKLAYCSLPLASPFENNPSQEKTTIGGPTDMTRGNRRRPPQQQSTCC